MLRHENQVLRRQLAGQLRWGHAGRLWLAALSRLVSRRRWPEVVPVTPAAILRWHRDLVARRWDCTGRRRPGRPATGTALKTLILRMARKNPAWGHRAIQGSWRGRGVRSGRPRCRRSCTPRASIWRPGGPGRPGGSSWPPRRTRSSRDFLVVETVLLKRLHVLVFIEHGTRRLHLAGVTAYPTGAWAARQARNLAMGLDDRLGTLRFMIHDRDLLFLTAFAEAFKAEGLRIITILPRTPRMYAICERVNRTGTGRTSPGSSGPRTLRRSPSAT